MSARARILVALALPFGLAGLVVKASAYVRAASLLVETLPL